VAESCESRNLRRAPDSDDSVALCGFEGEGRFGELLLVPGADKADEVETMEKCRGEEVVDKEMGDVRGKSWCRDKI
jgi:hypothetical protein